MKGGGARRQRDTWSALDRTIGRARLPLHRVLRLLGSAWHAVMHRKCELHRDALSCRTYLTEIGKADTSSRFYKPLFAPFLKIKKNISRPKAIVLSRDPCLSRE